jgi:hypothetical protein
MERPFSYIRQDFFLARTFRRLTTVKSHAGFDFAFQGSKSCLKHGCNETKLG